MKKLLVVAILALFCFNSFAGDELTIRIVDLDKKIVRVTYTWTMAYTGTSSAVLPDRGLGFTKYPIKVISVHEKNTDQELEYEFVDNAWGESLRIQYPSPIPNGGSYTMVVTVEAKTDDIIKNPDGSYMFTYKTYQNPYFILPDGHALVYCNHPVLLHERGKSTVCHVLKNDVDTVVFKTRAAK